MTVYPHGPLLFSAAPIPIPTGVLATKRTVRRSKHHASAASAKSAPLLTTTSTPLPLSVQRLNQYSGMAADAKLFHPLSDEYVLGPLYDESYFNDDDDDDDEVDEASYSSCSTFSSSNSTLNTPFSSFHTLPDCTAVPVPLLSSRASVTSFLSSSSYTSLAPSIVSVSPPAVAASTVAPALFVGPTISSTDSLQILLNSAPPANNTAFARWTRLFVLPTSMAPSPVPEPQVAATATTAAAQELTTFALKCVGDNADTVIPTSYKSVYKNRDQRINSDFLHLYALDYNARMRSRTLPNTSGSDDAELARLIQHQPQLKRFHYNHNLFHVSNQARDKLWNSVILPPRTDESPAVCIDSCQYVYVGNDSPECHCSLIRKSSNAMPWASTSSANYTIKPAGILKNGSYKFNGKAPNSGVTKSQFTVRGWSNPRWTDCSSPHT